MANANAIEWKKQTESATRNSEKQIQSFNRNFMSTWSAQSNTATLVKRKCVLHRLEGRVSSFSLFFIPPPFLTLLFIEIFLFLRDVHNESFVSFCFVILLLKCSWPGLSNIWRQPGFTTGQSPEENFGKICKNWGLVYLIGDLIPLVSKVLSPSSSWHGDRRTNKQPTESKSKLQEDNTYLLLIKMNGIFLAEWNAKISWGFKEGLVSIAGDWLEVETL